MGRRRLWEGGTSFVGASVPTEVYEILLALAKEETISISTLVRQAVMELIERRMKQELKDKADGRA